MEELFGNWVTGVNFYKLTSIYNLQPYLPYYTKTICLNLIYQSHLLDSYYTAKQWNYRKGVIAKAIACL